MGMSGQFPRSSTDFQWVKVSKPALPWQLPMPELPMPPKGRRGEVRWTMTSL